MYSFMCVVYVLCVFMYVIYLLKITKRLYIPFWQIQIEDSLIISDDQTTDVILEQIHMCTLTLESLEVTIVIINYYRNRLLKLWGTSI